MQEAKRDFGVEIKLKNPDSFLIVKETLSRIGIASKKSKTLFQTAHILHKQGTYKICHFKELFILDGKDSNIDEDDYRRRNSIAKMLDQWGLCTVINRSDLEFLADTEEIKIVPFKEKKDWSLIPKYSIGVPRKNLR